MAMLSRKLGQASVPAIGFGAMGFSLAVYGQVDDHEERFKVCMRSSYLRSCTYGIWKLLDRAYELGCTHWDSANVYGDSEEVIGKW